MTQEDKQLLLKDLCARLPYGIKCHFKYGSAADDVTLGCIDNGVARFEYGWYGRFHVSIDAAYIKPYLRPMSSMTEEEKKYLEDTCTMYNGGVNTDYESFGIEILATHPKYGDSFSQDFTALDWLNAHHFDYRGLIEKGLAIKAPKGMYNF